MLQFCIYIANHEESSVEQHVKHLSVISGLLKERTVFTNRLPVFKIPIRAVCHNTVKDHMHLLMWQLRNYFCGYFFAFMIFAMIVNSVLYHGHIKQS